MRTLNSPSSPAHRGRGVPCDRAALGVPQYKACCSHSVQCVAKFLVQAVAVPASTMAKDMTLYWASGSPPCWRVMIVLAEKNLQGYNSKLVSFEKGEHKSEEIMKLNPRGQVPTFKHGDVIVNESIGACMYLENCFTSQGTQLLPAAPAEQALVLQRVFETQTLQFAMRDALFYERFTPEGERHESALKRNKENLTKELKLWESYLQKMDSGSYLAGRTFSMADAVCFPVIAFFSRFGLSEERYPRLMAYYQMVKDRPSIISTWPPHWLENPQGQDMLKDL
ncbi:glutathione S-transferase rho [Electrophorus electricus]|uniref:Glutathione S-transferase rho n=1 Tax=Electrophorus electricus TaxID=8005 RepID=A0A4W4GH67_ELEEL|nr:glutathione S-transferase rho [Electrophorus electricus]